MLKEELHHLGHLDQSGTGVLRSASDFIKSSVKELSPWQNIKVMHTNIRGDILAGITVAIIALPLALAFGEMSQLGPIAGIWGAIAGGVVGGLFGGCLVGVSGPTAPKAAQIAAFMSVFVIGTSTQPDLVAAFSIIFLSGLILVGISMLKIARFIHYTPYSVVAGFMCGIGVIVILTQINAIVGLEAEKSIQGVFSNLGYTLSHMNAGALYVTVPSLVILFTWPFLEKKVKQLAMIPAPLVALILGTSIAFILQLDIPYIGDKMGGSDPEQVFSFYFPDLSRFSEFIVPALALAGLMIAMAIGVVFAFFRFVQEDSVLQPQGPLFFGSVEPLTEAYAAAPAHEKLVVDMSKVTMVDLSGIYALEDLLMDARNKNIEVFVANASPQIRKVLEKVDFIEHIGKDHYLNSIRSVIPVLLETYQLPNQQGVIENLDPLQVPMLEKFQKALNRHDLDAIMGLYAEDAILVPAFSSMMKKGKQEIRQFYEDYFKKDGVKISIFQAASQKLNGTKVDNGIYLMRWKKDGIRKEEQLRFSLVIKDGKIITDHSSVEPDFIATGEHLPKAYEPDFSVTS